MRKKLKKAGILLLIAAMLAQSVGSYTYAAEPGITFTETGGDTTGNTTGNEQSNEVKPVDSSQSSENEEKAKLPDSGDAEEGKQKENTDVNNEPAPQTNSPEETGPEIMPVDEGNGNEPEEDTWPINFGELEDSGITIVTEKDSYNEGDEVTFTIENASEREIESISVTLEDGTELELKEEEGIYSFTMPAAEVFLNVTLKLLTVGIDATVENGTASFDKEEYTEGDTVTATLTPEEGYAFAERFVTLTADGEEVPFEAEENGEALVVTFVLGDQDVNLQATAKKIHSISFTYTDVAGADCSAHFQTSVNTEKLIEGEEVKVSVEYSGSLGWAANIAGASGSVSFEQASGSLTFYMPDEDAVISIQEIEDYNTGNLDNGDTELGDDDGDGSGVTTKKEFEPDVTLGKSARWDDIEEGTATLTLTEEDISAMADAPSDYIIVLDRTSSMAVDYMYVAGSTPRDANGFASSVCLNPNHHYFLNGREVYLVDYGRGYYKDTGEFFRTEDYNHIYWTGDFKGSSAQLWKYHYDSSGRRIDPRVSNGCTDRLLRAQNSIKQILDILEEQNNTILQGGAKNRVMYWSFSGPEDGYPDGLWDEVPEFTEDIAGAKAALKYECHSGTYYYESFRQILKKLQEKQKDEEHKDIPTKVIFISDGYSYDSDSAKAQILQMSKEIRAMESTELYTILIGDTVDSDAGRLLQSYVKSGNFATVTRNWNSFLATITKIQQKKSSIDAVEKVITDKINTEYWEVVGEPVLESGNGTASLSSDKSTLTWNIPAGSGKTYTCKLKLKLKDEYRYLLADTSYPTNADEKGATPESIAAAPTKAGAVISYNISGGKYNTETRTVGIKSPSLKYGTVNFEGTKNWTVEGSNADSIRIQLTRTMPGSSTATEVNNTTTNVTRDWSYSFTVRRMPDGSTRPLIKYNNAGQEITYEVKETAPDYYTQLGSVKSESNGVIDTELYNEPFKVKAQLTKVDEETKNPLSGAEFSVYMWSALKKAYVPYKGTTDVDSKPHETGTINGAEEIVKLKEGSKGVYTTPVWLYYSPDNQGKFRIIETKAPEGYFGDWKDDEITNSDADKNVYDFEIKNDVSENGKTVIISNTSSSSVENSQFGNQRVKGEITFSKLDLEGKVPEPQADASLSGAVYKLYAAEDIVHQDGTTGVLYQKGEEIKVSAVSDLNGLKVYEYNPEGTSEIVTGYYGGFRVTNLELGKYYLKEVSASEGYLVDPDIYEVDVLYEGEKVEIVEKETDLFERVMKQSLSFYKYTADNNSDKLDPMKGAGFSVYLVSELEGGKYAALSDEELVQAVIDDLRNPTTLQYDTYEKYAPATVYADADSEDVTSGRLVKTVRYQNGIAYTASGKNEYYTAQLESDEKGVVTTPGLPYGRYIVIETKTPDGKTATRPFVINVTSDERDGIIDGDGKGTPLQDMQLTVLIDRPIMSLIRIMKRDSQSGNIVLKEGASYVIHDVDGAWYDYVTNEMTTAQKQAYKETYGDLVAQYSQGTYYGTKEDPFVTKLVKAEGDETANVYIETPAQLPSGTYELEEISAPEGYILQGEEGVIAKKASASGNGTYYETEEEGVWTDVPQGRTRFIVSNNESLYDETAMSYVTIVRQSNEPTVGKISIYAEGEALMSAEQIGSTLTDKLADKLESFFGYISGLFGLDTPTEDMLTEAELSSYQDYEFEYEVKPIEGAQFEIRAAEDIYSPEGGANAVKLFSEGDLVMTLTTDEKGQTWTGQEDWDGTDIAKGLPLGKYTVTQTVAGYGFALSEENAVPREIEIAYAGQTVPVIYKDTAYENPRQKVTIEVTKKDKEMDTLLSGATFGLYAEEDIKNYNGKTVVKAGTLVAMASTCVGENETVENAVFEPDLPLAKYYIRELKAPYGYSTSRDKISVDASYQTDQREVIEVSETVKNMQTKLQINLMDYFTEAELDGAQISVMDEDGNSFTTILTVHDNNTVIRGLEINKTYTVKELVSPEGYHYHLYIKDGYQTAKDGAVELDKEYPEGTVSDSVKFTVQDMEELQAVSVFNKPITGELTVEKTGEVAVSTEKTEDANGNAVETPVYEIKGLPGAEYVLRAKENIVYPDGYTGTLFSAGDTVLDKYAELKDAGVLKNYQLEVLDGCGELLDVSGYIGIKYDADSTEQEILDFYQEHGDEVERQIPSEEEILTGKTLFNGTSVKYTLKTGEDGIVRLSGIPLGEYEVIEVKAPEGYARDKAECIRDISITVPEDIPDRPEEIVEVKAAFENAKQEIPKPEQPDNPPKQVVYHPGILVRKEADRDVYEKGETVIYHITVVNNGDVELTDVTVEDSLAGGIIKTIDSLKAGEQDTFDYEYIVPADAEEGSRIDNVVYTTGTPEIPDPGMDENGNPILVDPSSYTNPSDSDTEKVFVKGKDIIVKKTAEKRIYKPGETAVYNIEVINPNAYELVDVKVEDSLSGTFKLTTDNKGIHVDKDGTVMIDSIPANGKVNLVYIYEISKDTPAGELENIVIATGTLKGEQEGPEPEKPVKDEDHEIIVVQHPKLTVTKESDREIYLPGETARYTITVTNTGNCDLVEIAVEEQLLKGGAFVSSTKGTFDGTDAKISELAAGESVTLVFEYTVPEDAETGSTIYNVVSATGSSKPVIDQAAPEKPDGTPNYLPTEPVSDNDMEEIHVTGFKEGLSVTKYSVDEGVKTPKAGAWFTLYAKEDVKNIFGTVIYAAGTEIETAVSGEDGTAYFTVDVPVGTYKVLETKAPDGHYSSDKEITFDLTRWKNDDSTHYVSLNDFVENAITAVKIRLTDNMTGNELADAALQVTDEDGNIVDAWITKVENGYVIKGLDVDTKYTIVETAPRDGYLSDITDASVVSGNTELEAPEENQVSFMIHDVATKTTSSGKLDKTSVPETAEMILENAFVVGEVRLNKDGEKLESWTLVDKLAAFVKSLFNFSRQPLEGVEFTIYAKEDILHPDGITGVVLHKGDVAATGVRGIQGRAVLKTNKLGVVSFEEMYLGSYEIVETATVKGFNLDIEPREITFAYVDGRTSPVKAEDGDIQWTNERQSVRIEVTKRDAEHPEKTIQGAVFGLYNKETIRNYRNEVLVESDTLLELSETDENGVAVFETDLPLGRYYIKETAAPVGYASSDEVIDIDASYDSGKEILEFKEDFFDKKIVQNAETPEEDALPVEEPGQNPAHVIGTGDNTSVMLPLFMAAASVLAIALIYKKKKSENNR